MRLQPLGKQIPMHQPPGIQPAQTRPFAPSSSNPVTKSGQVSVPFGLTTISFGGLEKQQPRVAKPITRPDPSLGNRLDYYA
jgi:hypothetical protein